MEKRLIWVEQKKTEDPPQGAPAWTTTFSDLMNLLLCFFVLLFSMSSVDAEKYAELVQSLSNGFGSFTIFSNKEADTLLDDELFPSSVEQAENIEEYEKDTGEPEEGMKKDEETGEVIFDAEAYIEEQNRVMAEELYKEISGMSESGNLDETIEISLDEKYQYVKISISGAILFDSGKSDIKKESEPILSRIGDILKNYEDHLIKIEGHTDNVPMTSGKYLDNMDLSSARAHSVWRFMTQTKLMDPTSLEASGRSEYEPVADNSTAEGRAKNRRVEFKIYTKSL